MGSKRLDPDDLNTILQTLGGFAETRMPLQKRLELDQQHHCPEKEIRELMGREIGMQLMFIPEEYGGLGGTAYDIYRFSEGLAKTDLGVATAL